MENNNGTISLKNVLTEKDLVNLLGLTKNQIGDLKRKKGLPFIKINQNSRLYFENDLIDFFFKKGVVLNRSEVKEE